MSEARKAKCFDCTANFADGRRDCQVIKCPLYIRMPYRKLPDTKIDFSWIFGKWNRAMITKAQELGITSPRAFVIKMFGSSGKIKLTNTMMFRAKCFECCADYTQPGNEKGRVDCGVLACPIYYYTPYRQFTPDYSWMFDLDYTKKHRIALNAIGCSQISYLEKLEAREL